MLTLKVTIDQDECIGCGVCANVCSEVFKLEGSVSVLVDEYKGSSADEGEVPDSVDCVDTAIEQCPVDAIEAQ